MPLELSNDNVMRRLANKLVQAIESAGGETFNLNSNPDSYLESLRDFSDDPTFKRIHLKFLENCITISIYGTRDGCIIAVLFNALHEQYFIPLRNYGPNDRYDSAFKYITGEEHELDLSPIVNYVTAKMK